MITERLMECGNFELQLKPGVWRGITSEFADIDIFKQLVILPAHIRHPRLTFAMVDSLAIYSGLVYETNDTTLRGVSMLARLGDPEGKGPTNAFVSPAPGFDTWTNLITDSFGGATNEITLGSFFSAPSGTIYDGFLDNEAFRTAIERWRKAVSAEYRVNPDLTFDSGNGYFMFNYAPQVLLSSLPIVDALDTQLLGLRAPLKLTTDASHYATSVHVDGDGVDGDDGSVKTVVVSTSWDTTDAGAADDRAAWERANEYVVAQRLEGASVNYYALRRFLEAGDWVYLWDPFQGLSDDSVQITYAGTTICPTSVRCTGLTWPVEKGMGVYLAYLSGGDLIDITDFVEWETGDVSLELSPPRTLRRALGVA